MQMQRQRQWQRQGQEQVQSRRLKDLPAQPPGPNQPHLRLRALRATPRNPKPNPNPKPNTELRPWPLAAHRECRRVQAAGCPSCGTSPSAAQRSTARQAWSVNRSAVQRTCRVGHLGGVRFEELPQLLHLHTKLGRQGGGTSGV